MDVAGLQRDSGWTVHRLAVTGSTNEVAARLVEDGAAARTVVLADRQTGGRGREGRTFLSPPGGLYASLLLDVPPEDLPAGAVALVAVAAAEAVEQAVPRRAAIKWPNDLWVGRKKVGGILLELVRRGRPVVAGLGINLRTAPAGLPAGVRDGVTGLGVVAGADVERQGFLTDLLRRVDAWQQRRVAGGGLDALEAAWRGRLALIGEDVTCTFAGRRLEGVLEDASLCRGLLVRDAVSGPVWRQAEHVQDLRPAGRTIS